MNTRRRGRLAALGFCLVGLGLLALAACGFAALMITMQGR